MAELMRSCLGVFVPFFGLGLGNTDYSCRELQGIGIGPPRQMKKKVDRQAVNTLPNAWRLFVG
jgi:hypothetical protein